MVANVDLKVLVTVVNEEDVNETSIVRIHDACPSVNAELRGKAATRGYLAISIRGNSDRQLGIDEGSSLSWDGLHLGTIKIIPSSMCRTTSRDSGT